ncbi:MAG: ABC transporter permease subunit [Theionarchaea archaeon]|nr:ABC transporter permease subunit [Theionarchaea archaeon]MBU7001057.1 ABC transporter permease subunit [Theionarchaea archaeon]MBU7020546.1 ABC transporter permease subunit [Theionarchaea archaeon]MBU7034187.1 ABC transporter permease subunit [Theionarchaea archaeon]MBU7039269.1 ABC transporter permease subunit [Theionarchaea archaeon]
MDSYEQSQGKRSIGHFLEKNVFLVLFIHEVRSGFKNPLQKGWIAGILFLGSLFTLGSRNLEAVSALLVLFIFFGSVVTLVLSSSSISGEIDEIADSLLSKSVKRWEYVLSKFTSHVVIVVTVYVMVVLLQVGILWRLHFLPESLDYGNLSFFIMIVGLVLVFFSSVGVLFSSLFSRTVLSLLAGFIVWFLLVFLFLATGWNFMYSPVEIFEHFLPILEGSWDVEYWKILLFYTGSSCISCFVSLLWFYQRDL